MIQIAARAEQERVSPRSANQRVIALHTTEKIIAPATFQYLGKAIAGDAIRRIRTNHGLEVEHLIGTELAMAVRASGQPQHSCGSR